MLNSCVMSKDVFTFNYDTKKGADIAAGDFIEFNDGGIKKGEVSDFNFKVFFGKNTKGSVTMGNDKYNVEEIKAFQKGSSYYRKLNSEKYFVQRLKGGKINLYYRHMPKTAGTDSRGRMYDDAYDLHYLQKGNESSIEKFSVKLLETMVADNAAAMKYIDKYKSAKKDNSKNLYLDKAMDIYNGDVVVD